MNARQPCYALDEDFCIVVEDFARYGELAPGMLALLRELAEVNEAMRNDVQHSLAKAHDLLLNLAEHPTIGTDGISEVR